MEDNYLKLVSEMNDEVYDKHGVVTNQWYYTSNGSIDVIGFGDIMLWNSENEEREFIYDDNDWEPMKPFLKKKLKELGESFIKISKS